MCKVGFGGVPIGECLLCHDGDCAAGEAVCRGGMGEGEDEIVKKVGIDPDDEYLRYRRRQRIHHMHLVGYAVFAALTLMGMLIFWR